MSLYLQYHNNDKRGLECLLSAGDQRSIFTRRPNVKDAQGTVFLIVGIGRPRQFFLWEAFDIERVKEEPDGTYVAYGPGWQLCPPQRLEGAEFEAFKNSCAYFVGFQRIDDLSYSTTLKELAEWYRRPSSGEAMRSFLGELLGLVKEGTEDHEIVLQEMQAQPAAPDVGQRPPSPPKPITQRPPTVQQGSAFMKDLQALSIRQPHAEAIIRGIKKIEYRNMPTKIRGRVQIYASLDRYSPAAEAEMLEEYSIDDIACDDLPRGVLIGTVEVHDCTGKASKCNWHLRNPKRATKFLKPKKQPQPVWFNPF